jgi:hypothetical protein
MGTRGGSSRQNIRAHLGGGGTLPQVSPHKEKNQLVKVYEFNWIDAI